MMMKATTATLINDDHGDDDGNDYDDDDEDGYGDRHDVDDNDVANLAFGPLTSNVKKTDTT